MSGAPELRLSACAVRLGSSVSIRSRQDECVRSGIEEIRVVDADGSAPEVSRGVTARVEQGADFRPADRDRRDGANMRLV